MKLTVVNSKAFLKAVLWQKELLDILNEVRSFSSLAGMMKTLTLELLSSKITDMQICSTTRGVGERGGGKQEAKIN